MGERLLRLTSLGLFLFVLIWSLLDARGYAPWALLGFAIGEFCATVGFGARHGHLGREGEFHPSDAFLGIISLAAFVVLRWRSGEVFSMDVGRNLNMVMVAGGTGAAAFLLRLLALTGASL